MNIAIDLRSLSSGSISGVENYIVNVLDHLLPMDRHNRYSLFYNSLKGGMENFHFVNSEIKRTRVPNKLLNAALKFNLTSLEKIMGPVDCVFLPNLNQFSLHPHTKLALTVHDMSPVVTPEFYDVKRRLWHRFLNYRAAFRRANIIFAVSEYTKHDIVDIFGVAESKIRVVYPGVDPALFSPAASPDRLRALRNEYGLPGKFVLFLSTIEPRKNLGNLIRAFEALDDDTHLVIAGKKGWKYRDVFRQIKASKKSGTIHYIGYVSEADKPHLMELAYAVAYPSFYEGFGFVPVEAMSLGVPVIAGSVTAMPEVVSDAALLVNPYDVAEMAEALREVLGDGTLRTALIEKGKRRAASFRWEKTAREILDGLNSLA